MVLVDRDRINRINSTIINNYLELVYKIAGFN